MLSPAKKGIPESSLASKSSAWKIQMNFLRCFCWCIPWVCAHLGVWGSVVGRIEHWRGIKGTATTHTAKVRAKQVRAPTGECEHRYFRCDVSAMSVRCIVRVWCLTVRIQGVVCIALGVKNATFPFVYSLYRHDVGSVRTYAQISGMVTAGWALGAMVGPPAAGAIADHLSFEWSITISAMLHTILVSDLFSQDSPMKRVSLNHENCSKSSKPLSLKLMTHSSMISLRPTMFGLVCPFQSCHNSCLCVLSW